MAALPNRNGECSPGTIGTWLLHVVVRSVLFWSINSKRTICEWKLPRFSCGGTDVTRVPLARGHSLAWMRFHGIFMVLLTANTVEGHVFLVHFSWMFRESCTGHLVEWAKLHCVGSVCGLMFCHKGRSFALSIQCPDDGFGVQLDVPRKAQSIFYLKSLYK